MKRSGKKIAAALSYHEGDVAPKIVASGKGIIAERIITEAQSHDIPVLCEPALSASLVALPVQSCIPEALYQAVAEVIAFCYLTYKDTRNETHSD